MILSTLGAVPLVLTEVAVYWQTNEIRAFRDSTALAETELVIVTDFRAKVRNRLLVVYDVMVNPAQVNAAQKMATAETEINAKLAVLRKFYGVQAGTEMQPARLATEAYSGLDSELDQVQVLLEAKNYPAGRLLLDETKRTLFYGKFLPEITQVIKDLESKSLKRSQLLSGRLDLLMRMSLLISVFGYALATLVSFLIGRTVIRRIKNIETGARAVGGGELHFRLKEDGDDELTELVSAFNKMTADLERANGRLLEQQNQLMSNAKLVSLGEMAGGIAHEINNPLSIISGKVRAIRKVLGEDPTRESEANHHLDRVEVTVQRISGIIKGLRAYARDGAKDPFTENSIKTLITDTLTLCQERFVSGGVEIRMGEIPDLRLDCRAVQLSQVLVNLLNNAYDAIQSLPHKWVQIEVRKEFGGKLKLIITDSGAGIDPATAEKMMQPFFTTKPVGQGTGLGLSISLGLIRDHGGTLSLDSTSKNTCFVLELPLVQAKAERREAS